MLEYNVANSKQALEFMRQHSGKVIIKLLSKSGFAGVKLKKYRKLKIKPKTSNKVLFRDELWSLGPWQ